MISPALAGKGDGGLSVWGRFSRHDRLPPARRGPRLKWLGQPLRKGEHRLGSIPRHGLATQPTALIGLWLAEGDATSGLVAFGHVRLFLLLLSRCSA